MTITCPNERCARQHALFWYVDGRGKRQLSYRCNQVLKERFKLSGGVMVSAGWHTGNAMLPYDAPAGFVPSCDLGEVWSKGWSRKQAGKKQFQLVMTHKL